MSGFYLGGAIDPATGERTDDLIHYDPPDLTTHGVIVGMTGSGKTGLGVIYLEEALLAGIPTLIIDPKGDMTNLLLTFPELAPADFEPWIDESEARKEGVTVAAKAEATAELWRSGLASWDQDGSRIAQLRNGADLAIYTPGSGAGIPLNIVGSLASPGLDWADSAETLRDEIQGFASGLLGLLGIDADPISSREHILISNLIEHAWREGRDLDLESLLGWIQHPPFRKLGVFEVDTFFPEKDRVALAMKLNGLIASPAFAAWITGEPLDVGSMLRTPDGRPRAAIVYLAHLSDQERQFVTTLVLSKVVTWMRSQTGTADLRAMVYMDEVFGFVPPTANPPAKKPILTLLKQARAFGVGLLLSTQNPVDLDYKAMSNAGTWCVGRLQTERDKARILEALKSARGDSDVTALDAAISGLGKRQFLLHSTREPAPQLFTTRWAMSYLRGPLTRDQVGTLMDEAKRRAEPDPLARANRAPVPNAGAEAAQQHPAAAPGADETPVMPRIAEGIPVSYVDPAAPWAARLGSSGATRLEPALAARVGLVYDDRHAGVTHDEEWEAIFHPLTDPFDPDRHLDVDYDERDFLTEPPAGAVYALVDAKLDGAAYYRSAGAAVKEYLYRNQSIEVFKNAELGLYSRVGEDRADFFTRCDRAAQDRADAETAKLRDKYETRIDRVRDQLASAERRVDELATDLQGQRTQQVIDGAGLVIGILTGRRTSRSATRTMRAVRSKEARLRTAQEKAADKSAEIQELQEDLLADVAEINDRWEDAAGEIEPVEIGLEKNDIRVDELRLVWVPVDA